ncbi:MAG: DUF368 domain-containing protein, partial [Lentisphaerae bacterium]
IIPGVSGGTMALVLGIYERLVKDLNKLRPDHLKVCLPPYPEGVVTRWRKIIKEFDLMFLGAIAGGAALAVVLLANLLRWLLAQYPAATFGFFWGLILISILVPLRQVKSWKGGVIPLLLAGTLLTAWLGYRVASNEVEHVRHKMQIKYAHLLHDSASADEHKPASTNRSPAISMGHLLFLVLGGAFAAAACVLPGVSGSFTLLLMGLYYELLEAVVALTRLNISLPVILTLTAGGLGGVAGLFLFAKLMETLLNRYRELTMAFLTGLMLGSLYAIWPFREAIKVSVAGHEKIAYGLPHLPNLADTLTWITAGTVILGALIGLVMDYFERKHPELTSEKDCLLCGQPDAEPEGSL